MGNNICDSEGPEVNGWVILKKGDERFEPEFNDNKPFYYHPEHNLYWRRNIMGYGPPLTEPPQVIK